MLEDLSNKAQELGDKAQELGDTAKTSAILLRIWAIWLPMPGTPYKTAFRAHRETSG